MRAWKAFVLVTAAAILAMAAWASVSDKSSTTAQGGPSSEIESTGSTTPDSLDRAFAAGGRIAMDLSAGGYKIEGAPGDRIEIRWSVRDNHRLRDVRVRADVKGTDAKITADGPSNNNFHVTIRVPARADLHVRLSAGELSLSGVEGHKDVGLRAGELDIDVGRADDYSQVEASLWAGEISAAPFRISKEGLFRSFKWRGPGKYRLQAELMAGEIRLRAVTAGPLER
jgi:hypothetical protein